MSGSPKLLSQRFSPNAALATEAPEPRPKADPEEVLPDSEKNARFKALKKQRGNKKCCNCAAKFPQWASATFGILICMNCSGKHRFLGPNISFVRSVAMDKWKERELRTMELGGNKRFHAYLEAEMISGEIDYDGEALRRYRRQLAQEVAQEFRARRLELGEPESTPARGQGPPKETDSRGNAGAKEAKEVEAPEEELRETKQAKPLEEQKTRVVMAEAKQKSPTSEASGAKRGRRRGKNKRFGGKRVAKVDLDQLVTDDLDVKTKAEIKKKGLFEMQRGGGEEPAKPGTEAPASKGQSKKQPNNFLSSEAIQKKIQSSRLNKFSGFGSDNLAEDSSAGGRVEIDRSSSGVYGGYGSDDLTHKSQPRASEESKGGQAGEDRGIGRAQLLLELALRAEIGVTEGPGQTPFRFMWQKTKKKVKTKTKKLIENLRDKLGY